MELKCLGGGEEVKKVVRQIVETRDYRRLDRLLSWARVKKKLFDVKLCQQLLQIPVKSRKDPSSRAALVKMILDRLAESLEPDELLYNTIIDACKKFSHNEVDQAIGNLMYATERKRDKDICFFLKRMHFSLKLSTHIGFGASLKYLELANKDLTSISNTNSCFSDINIAVDMVMNMISTHDETDLTRVVETCLNFLHRGTYWQYVNHMMERARLLKLLLATNKYESLQSYLVEFASDFAERAGYFGNCFRELEGESKDKFIQATTFLIQFGTQADYDKFGKYVIKSIDLFSAFVNAVMSVSGAGLLREVLNKCLLQYSVTDQDTLIRNWTIKETNHEPIPPAPSLHIQKVLELCPNIVQMVDKDRRLPIHYATASATASFEVIMEVLKANNGAAAVRDPVTGIFPFQLAASSNNVEASFKLLLTNPNISGGIIVGNGKRKRSSDA